MAGLTLTDPMPKRAETDILGIQWRVDIMIRYGIERREAYEIARRFAGLPGEYPTDKMLSRMFQP